MELGHITVNNHLLRCSVFEVNGDTKTTAYVKCVTLYEIGALAPPRRATALQFCGFD
jgi:hypothetical protein